MNTPPRQVAGVFSTARENDLDLLRFNLNNYPEILD